MMTSFRIGIGASRIAEVLNKRLGIDDRVACLFFMETGGQTTYSGEGYLLEDFKKNGKISNYSGNGEQTRRIYDREFSEASLRCVNFSETYHKLQYDCRDSKYFD